MNNSGHHVLVLRFLSNAVVESELEHFTKLQRNMNYQVGNLPKEVRAATVLGQPYGLAELSVFSM